MQSDFFPKSSHMPPADFQTGQCPQLLLLWKKLYKKNETRKKNEKIGSWLEQLGDTKCLRLTVSLCSGLLCAVPSVRIVCCLHAIKVTYNAEMNEGCYTVFIHS